MKRAPQPACPSGYTYYDTTCDYSGYFEGCFNEEPCEHLDNDDTLSGVPALGVSELTTNTFPAAVSSTLTTTTTNSAHTRTATTTIPTSSISSRSASNAPPLSTSSILAQPATFVAAVPSTPAITSSVLAQTTALGGAVASSLAKPSLSPSSSHIDTAAVAAGTVGAVTGAIIALTLMLLVIRWRKRRTEKDLRAYKQDNDERVQDVGVNGVGGPFHCEDDNGLAPAYRDADHGFPAYRGTSDAGNDENIEYKLSDWHTALPSLSPIQPLPKVSGPMLDATGRQHELEVPRFHSPVELSPKPEHSLTNHPRQIPSPSRVNSSGQVGLERAADEPVMHANLDSMGEGAGEPVSGKTGGSHVMSWMSYDGDGYGSGPER